MVRRLAFPFMAVLALAAGFMMVTCSADFADFAPVRIPVQVFYALMVFQGAAAALLMRGIGRIFISLLTMNLASTATFLMAILFALTGIGIPLEPDLVMAWALSPVALYLSLMLILQSCGVFIGMLFAQ